MSSSAAAIAFLSSAATVSHAKDISDNRMNCIPSNKQNGQQDMTVPSNYNHQSTGAISAKSLPHGYPQNLSIGLHDLHNQDYLNHIVKAKEQQIGFYCISPNSIADIDGPADVFTNPSTSDYGNSNNNVFHQNHNGGPKNWSMSMYPSHPGITNQSHSTNLQQQQQQHPYQLNNNIKDSSQHGPGQSLKRRGGDEEHAAAQEMLPDFSIDFFDNNFTPIDYTFNNMSSNNNNTLNMNHRYQPQIPSHHHSVMNPPNKRVKEESYSFSAMNGSSTAFDESYPTSFLYPGMLADSHSFYEGSHANVFNSINNNMNTVGGGGGGASCDAIPIANNGGNASSYGMLDLLPVDEYIMNDALIEDFF